MERTNLKQQLFSKTLNKLQDRLRNEARTRSKQARQDVLTRERANRSQGDGATVLQCIGQSIQSALHDLVHEAVCKQAGRDGQVCNPPATASAWQDEEVESALRAFTPEEMEALTAELESSLVTDCVAREIAEWQQSFEEAELVAAADGAQAGHSEAGVPCPVCHQCALQQRHGMVVCPVEGWQVNRRGEGDVLGFIQHQLAATYQAHYEEAGCKGRLVFGIETPVPGFTSLMARCTQCALLSVIL